MWGPGNVADLSDVWGRGKLTPMPDPRSHPRSREAARRLPLRGLLAITLAVALALISSSEAQARRMPGIDVSRFDGTIRWSRVTDAGIRFAFVQAGRGSGEDCTVRPRRCGRDGFYDRNYRRATAEGIRVGAYHRAFAGGQGRASVEADARAEALVFIGEVGRLHEGDLRPALDVEDPFSDLSESRLALWVRTWLDRVEGAFGARPLIYTNVSSWARTGDSTEFALAGHPLWVANWDVPSPAVPAANWGGEGWSVWQYTSSGHLPGIEGRVDRDVLRGGLRSLSVPPARRRLSP